MYLDWMDFNRWRILYDEGEYGGGVAGGRHRKRILTLILWWSGPTCCKLRVLVVSTNEVPGEPSRLEELHSELFALLVLLFFTSFFQAHAVDTSLKVWGHLSSNAMGVKSMLSLCWLCWCDESLIFLLMQKSDVLFVKCRKCLKINCQHLWEASPSVQSKQKWVSSDHTTHSLYYKKKHLPQWAADIYLSPPKVENF